MVSAKLMAEFVGDIINIKGIAHRRAGTGDTAAFPTVITDDAQIGHAATTGAKDMADIIVGRADHAVQVVDILVEHSAAIIVAVGISGGVGVDDQIVIRHQDHAHGYFPFIDGVDAVHGCVDGRQGFGYGAAMKLGVLAGCGHCQSIGAQLRTRGQQRRARCTNGRQLFGPGAVGVERFGFSKLFGRRTEVAFEITGVVGDIVAEEGINVDRIATA